MNITYQNRFRKFLSWQLVPLTCVSLCLGINAVHADSTYIVVHDGETVEAVKGETYTQGWIAMHGGTITGQNNIVYGRNQISQGIANDYAIGVEHSGGSITIEGVDGIRAQIISSTAAAAKGVQVAGTGTFHALNTDIISNGVGVRSEGNGMTDIYLDNVTVTTNDTGSAYGVLMDFGSYAHIKDSTISTTGTGTGSRSNRAIYSSQGSRIDLSGNINANTAGDSSSALYVTYSNASGDTCIVADDTSNVVARTQGSASYGVHAYQQNNAGKVTVQLDGLLDVLTTGSTSYGLASDGVNSSIVYTGDQDGGIVRTEGASSAGVSATGGGLIDVTNLTVESQESYGARVTGNSTVTMTDSTITTENSTNGHGVYLSTSGSGQEAAFNMTGGTIDASAHGFWFADGSAGSTITVTITDSTITPGEGKRLITTSNGRVSSADFNVDNSTLAGTIYTYQGSVVRSEMNDVNWSSVGQSTLTEYTLTGNSVLGMTIDTVDSYDYINATLNMMMEGTITINMHIAESVDNLVAGTEFHIFRTTDAIDNLSATYVWNPDIVLNQGLSWDTSRLYAEGIVEIIATPVPEPGTATLSLLALASLMMRRKRV